MGEDERGARGGQPRRGRPEDESDELDDEEGGHGTEDDDEVPAQRIPPAEVVDERRNEDEGEKKLDRDRDSRIEHVSSLLLYCRTVTDPVGPRARPRPS